MPVGKNHRKKVQGSPRPNNHFAKLKETPEGRAQLAEWQALKGTKGKLGRPHGALDGTTAYRRDKSYAAARAEAKEIVKHMEEKGIAIPKDQYAREAFEEVVTLMRQKQINPKDKLAAARTVLEYSMAKPAAESTVTVKRAEDFLDELASDMKDTE